VQKVSSRAIAFALNRAIDFYSSIQGKGLYDEVTSLLGGLVCGMLVALQFKNED
jgi:hypothetical protein